MYFNEIKYRKCIGHLIAIKTCVVISFIVIFACLGAGVGYPLIEYTDILDYLNETWQVYAITSVIGALIGLLIGLFSTWRIEMHIQECYWKIDVLNELQKQTTYANKNTPVAKTVVAIENKANPTNTAAAQTQPEQKQE